MSDTKLSIPMKKLINIISSLAILAAAAFAAGCDQTSVDEVVVSAPVIHSFSPASAPVGERIVITGEYLNAVTKATIGGVEVPIAERVSNTRLSIVASADARSGRIALSNTEGTGESAEEFTYSYAAPEITAAILQPSVDMGDQMLIAGKYMGAVEAVIFTAEGYTEGNEAAIISRTSEELVVKCPYVEADAARITLRYFNGTSHVETSLADAPVIEVKRYQPVFDAVTFERTAVGRSVVVTGSYLDKVDKILVGEFEAQIFKEHSKLTFTVPAGDFPDGDTETKLVASYFDGHETYTLSDKFVVFVPFVKYWENMRVWGHGKTAEQLACFFSPETGRVYSNAAWRTDLDPVAFQYQASTCSSAQTPAVSEEEYNSVMPYFYFYCNNSCVISVNSPASSNGLLKNFWIANAAGNENRLPGQNGNCWGTAVMGFRALNATNAIEKELIDKVRNGQIENIDEALFPIDEVNKTVGGIGVGSASAQLKDSDWAPDMFGDKKSDVLDVKPDAVILALYYDYRGPGLDSDNKLNYASHVKRIGLLHITNVNFRIDQTNSAKPATLSDYTFNIYWQKYDYDYSKVK